MAELAEALRALDVTDRQRVLDWWSLAEQRMKTPDGDPSAPAEAVGMSTLIELVGFPERAVPLWIAARAGYAPRFYVGQFAVRVWPLDVAVLDRERIVALASAPADDLCDALLAGDDDVHRALSPVASLVSTYAETEFEAVASIEPAFWDGLLQVATYQLQQNLGRVFDVETVEPVLRFGVRAGGARRGARARVSGKPRVALAHSRRDRVRAVRRPGDAVGHVAPEPPGSAFSIVAKGMAGSYASVSQSDRPVMG